VWSLLLRLGNLLIGLRWNENAIAAGVQTERRGVVGPVRDCLGCKPAPTAWRQGAKVWRLCKDVAAAIGVVAAAVEVEDVVRVHNVCPSGQRRGCLGGGSRGA
jgi:hypothetical protein